MNSITEQELKGVVAGYFNELTDAFELGRAQTGPLTEGEWRDEKLRLKETHLTLKGKLKRRDYTGFTGAAEFLLGKAGVALKDMDHQSSEF